LPLGMLSMIARQQTHSTGRMATSAMQNWQQQNH